MNEIVIKKDSDGNLILNELCNAKRIFENCRINFLLGAGFSMPLLNPLNDLETIIEHLDRSKDLWSIIAKAYILWYFFQKSIFKLTDTKSFDFKHHHDFGRLLQRIIQKRSSPIFRKQINVFTTNYDPIIELCTDELTDFICNDGFSGNLKKKFSTDNFCKVVFRQAIFSENMAEVPMINLLKLHGSITWQKDNQDLMYVDYQSHILKFHDQYKSLFQGDIFSKISTLLESEHTIKEKILSLKDIFKGTRSRVKFRNFINYYTDFFAIVNPTKEKFCTTVMKMFYHEMLRIYSNELEKQNSLLLVFGFSFADEHIFEITRRSLINPSLLVYIFCYDENSFKKMQDRFSGTKCTNVTLVRLDDEHLNLQKFNAILTKIMDK